jgi:streptogrisin C
MTSKFITAANRAAVVICATTVATALGTPAAAPAPAAAATVAPDPGRFGPPAASAAPPGRSAAQGQSAVPGRSAAPGQSTAPGRPATSGQERGQARGTAAPEPAPALADAIRRDLGLTPSQARVRLAAEQHARSVEKRLRDSLGTTYGGSWLTSGAKPRLMVGVTDAARAAEVRAAGAHPRTVARSERQLGEVKERLDRHAKRVRRAPRAIAGWYADVGANSVVVLVRPRERQTAARFVEASGVRGPAVRIRSSRERPRLLYDVRGGDAYYIEATSRCSIGFSVQGGFVSAGHCGDEGDQTSGYNRVPQGEFAGSSFPGNDYSWVTVNEDWTPRGVVLGQGGTEVPVAGSDEASIGASVCRSGSTTGWHCGTIRAKNQTVNYPQGTVQGLTRTNVCAQPGDSGGPYISGSQAQGVLSGGSGNCNTGGTTYFQPVNEILQAAGLTLVTAN